MNSFWPKGWEENWGPPSKCSTCGRDIYHIEWTNGGQDQVGGSGWAAVNNCDGRPLMRCSFWDEEQGSMEDNHYPKKESV